MMQNQERRQRRLSNLSTGTGNTNKTSSTQRAENSTTAVGSAKAISDVTFHGRCDSRRTIQQFNKQLESIP